MFSLLIKKLREIIVDKCKESFSRKLLFVTKCNKKGAGLMKNEYFCSGQGAPRSEQVVQRRHGQKDKVFHKSCGN